MHFIYHQTKNIIKKRGNSETPPKNETRTRYCQSELEILKYNRDHANFTSLNKNKRRIKHTKN